MDDVANQLNKMNQLLTQQNNKVGGYSDSMASVMGDMEKVFKRFKPNKMVNYLNESEDMAKNSMKDSKSQPMPDVISSVGEQIGDLNDSFSMENLEGLLENLIDVNLDKDSSLGNLNLEGLNTTPQNLIESLQNEIDLLAEKTNNFYDVLVEERFNGDMGDEITRFKEETEDWLVKVDSDLEGMFDREEDYREFKRDTNDFLDDFEDNVDDTGSNLGGMMDKIFSPATAGAGMLMSMGGIRDAVQDVTSMEDVRRSMQQEVGMTRDEAAGRIVDSMKRFGEYNKANKNNLDLQSDLIEGIQSVTDTQITANNEIYDDLVQFASINRQMLGGMDLQGWDWVKTGMEVFEGDAVGSIQDITNLVGYLGTELEVAPTKLMSYVQDFDSRFKKLSGNVAEDYEVLAQSMVNSASIAEHSLGEDFAGKIMGQFQSIIEGGGFTDENIRIGFTTILGMNPKDIRKELEQGNFEGVMTDYLHGIKQKYEELGLSESPELAKEMSKFFGLDSMEDANDVIANMEKANYAVEKTNESVKDSEGFDEYFNKFLNASTWIEQIKATITNSEWTAEGIRLWNELGMSGEALLGTLIGLNQIKGILPTDFIKNTKLAKSVMGTLSGKTESLKIGMKMYGSAFKDGIKSMGSSILDFSKGALQKGKKGLTVFKDGIKSVGSSMLDFSKGALQKGKKGLTMFKNGIKSVGSNVLTFSKTMIKQGVKSVVSFATSLWSGAISGLGALKTGLIAGAGAAKTFAIALLANPITWIVVGVVALGVAIWQLWKNWDKVTAFLSDSWGKFTDKLGKSITDLKEWFSSIPVKISEIWESFKNILNSTPDWVLALIAPMLLIVKKWGDIKEAGLNTWNNIKEGWSGFKGWFGGLLDGAGDKWQNVKDKSRDAWEGVTDKWSGFKGWFNERFDISPENIKLNALNAKDSIIKGYKGFNKWFGGLFSAENKMQYLIDTAMEVKNKVKDIWSDFKDWFGDIFDIDLDPILNTIQDLFRSLASPIISIFNNIIGGLNKISVEIPNWVPKIGGNKFGFNIPEIPMFSEGAIATEPTLAMIAEENKPEVVLPIDKIGRFMSDILNSNGSSSSFIPQPSIAGSSDVNTQSSVLKVVTDNQEVVGVLEWQTKRLEKKLDTLISNTKDKKTRGSNNNEKPQRGKFYNLD